VISKEKYYQEQLDSMQDMMERTTAYMEELQEELSEAKQLLEDKHGQLLESVNYASKIQNLLLPSHDFFASHFEDYYWHVNQRDRIGGDFIYNNESDDKIFFGLFDCTGHGVPGSLLAVMGHRLLEESFFHDENPTTESVMTAVNDGFQQFFKVNTSDLQDGMEGILCSLDKSTQKLSVTSAGRPLLLRRGTDWQMIKRSQSSIGGRISSSFTENVYQLSNKDEIFIFSDGLVDQFGGDRDKKFLTKRVLSSLKNEKHVSISDRLANLETHHKMWMSGWDQIDDVSFLGVKLK
jgi:serine phosphatase RsbU (regulator of sigma subunit)